MKKLLTGLGLLLTNCFAIYSQSTTLTLQPSGTTGKDAVLHGLSSEANTNYGDSQEFPAAAWTFGGTSASIRNIFEFDLSAIPPNTTITSAYLSLYAIDNTNGLGQHSTQSGSNASWLERITTSWTESSVTWNAQPQTTTQNRISIPASTSATQNYPDIDVTNLVADMVSNPASSFGFMLKLQNEAYYRRMNFASSDHTNSALRPKLIITYAPSGTTTCFTLQPTAAEGKDALLHGLSSEANTNYGNGPELPAAAWTFGGASALLRGLISFDLSSVPTNGTVTSASLSLYAIDNTNGLGQHSTQSGSNESWLERVISTWEESTVTWNNQPSTTTQNRVSIPSSTSPTQNYTLNVTPLVLDMVGDPSNSHGFLLKLQTESYYRRMNFATSDHSNPSLRPKLEVCYTIPTRLPAIENKSKLSVYPNPTNGQVTLDVSPELSKTDYVIIDQLGREVLNGTVDQESTIIQVENLPSGIYIIRLKESFLNLKLIKN